MNKQQIPPDQNPFQDPTNQYRASTIYENNPPDNRVQTRMTEKNIAIKQVEPEKQLVNTEESIKYWLISLVLFVAAFGVYAGVWAVERFALNHQIASHYYQKSYKWSDAVPGSHQSKIIAQTKTIALDLVLQWVMWKAPLLLFSYNCMRLNEGKLKWILFGVTAVVLLAADIVLTMFLPSIYNTMMYFGLFSILTVFISAIANSSIGRIKQSVMDSIMPLFCIAVLGAIQMLGLPILYYVYASKLSAQTAVFLTFYAYPLIDLAMYALILFMGSLTSKEVRTFYSQIHNLLIGYEVGFILLIGYMEVEFYYLVSYLIFRNIFSNWVMWNWDRVVKLPPLLPGWGLAYYFSYALIFLPFSGIGNIIIGTGYYSIILTNTNTVLYNIPSSLYPYDTYTPSNPNDYAMNLQLKGQMFKIAAAIIWVGTTFTQRYSKKMPEIFYSIIYNLFGIYLFYIGLAAGLSTPSLTKYCLIA